MRSGTPAKSDGGYGTADSCSDRTPPYLPTNKGQQASNPTSGDSRGRQFQSPPPGGQQRGQQSQHNSTLPPGGSNKQTVASPSQQGAPLLLSGNGVAYRSPTSSEHPMHQNPYLEGGRPVRNAHNNTLPFGGQGHISRQPNYPTGPSGAPSGYSTVQNYRVTLNPTAAVSEDAYPMQDCSDPQSWAPLLGSVQQESNL